MTLIKHQVDPLVIESNKITKSEIDITNLVYEWHKELQKFDAENICHGNF